MLLRTCEVFRTERVDATPIHLVPLAVDCVHRIQYRHVDAKRGRSVVHGYAHFLCGVGRAGSDCY